MTLLVLGAGGQLGLDLLDAFADHDVVGLTHAELDVADEAAVWDAVASHTPHLVVNAAAWTDVDGCEADPLRAHRVNALGPWWVARACAATDAVLVQVSTDYVFSGPAPVDGGGSPRGWSEFDPVAPRSVYGRTKAAGEELVRQTLPAHHIVRTSWVNGARGGNFVRTMLRLAHAGTAIRVVDDQVGSPTFTRDLAAAIRELAVTSRYGTVNRANTGSCSWYELAAAIFEEVGIPVDLARQSTAELGRPAPRPEWSVLDQTHATASGLTPLPAWRGSLTALLRELGASGGRPSGPSARR
jgi:dTDP-4-dehydrorhamnose reductase